MDTLLNVSVDRMRYSRATHSRLYVTIKDETILEHLMNRRSRPVKEWRKYAIAALVQLGIDYKEIRWSNYAGCSMCPCSGGFIVKGDKYRNIYVTIG